jgi:hypothetical protein
MDTSMGACTSFVLARAVDITIPVLEFAFKSCVNTLAFPFMLLFMATAAVVAAPFESFFAALFEDFLAAPLLGPFAAPFGKLPTLPTEKQPPILVMEKVQQTLKQGIEISSQWLTGGLFSHTKDEDPINPITIVLKQ